MADRSTREEVRNPIIMLPGFAALRALDPSVRAKLVEALKSLQSDARERADKCWRTHKAPMAVYWKAVAVYAGHIARAIKHG